MNDAVTAAAVAADHRVAARKARVQINLIWEVPRWPFREKKETRGEKMCGLIPRRLDGRFRRGFLDFSPSFSRDCARIRVLGKGAVHRCSRDIVNIFDLIAI